MTAKTACPICRENHEPRGLSWDGIGINACGMYRSRMATFHPDYREHGPAIVRAANSFDAMREALTACVDALAESLRVAADNEEADALGSLCYTARAALALAEQEKMS